MNRRIAQFILFIVGACPAGMTVAVVIYMLTIAQQALANGDLMIEQMLVLLRLALILGMLALFFWGAVNILEDRIVWLYISAFLELLIWVIYDAVRDAIAKGRLIKLLMEWVFILGGLIVSSVVFLGLGLLISGIGTIRRKVRQRQLRLPEGVTIEMVLRESPYRVERSQEGTFIIDKRSGEFVDWQEPDGAEAWIIRQYLKQRRNENRTSAGDL